MQRNTEESIHSLLKATHAQRHAPGLTDSWRRLVMAEISDLDHDPAPNWEQLAPRFALAGATLSMIALIVGTWSLSSLPDLLYEAYANQILDVTFGTLRIL